MAGPAETIEGACPGAVVDARRSFVRLLLPVAFEEPAAFGELWENRSAAPRPELLPHVERYLERGWLYRLEHNRGLGARTFLGGNEDWRVVDGSAKDGTGAGWPDGIDFVWESVDVNLYEVGVGFLELTLRPTTSDLGVWLTAQHRLRFTDGRRSHLAVRAKTGRASYAGFTPGKGVDSKSTWSATTVDDLMGLLLGDKWWERIYVADRALVYSAIFVDGVPAARQGLVGYAATNFFHGRQPLIPPDETPAQPVVRELLPYVGGQRFLTTIEGSTFLAFDAPEADFFDHELPAHLRRDYGFVYSLVAQQRFAFVKFLSRASEDASADKLVRLLNRFIRFSAAGHELQAVQREHHHRYFESCRRALQLDAAYSDLQSLMNALQTRADYQRSESSRKLADTVVFALVIPTLLLGLFGINIEGWTADESGMPQHWALAIFAASVLVVVGAWLRLRTASARTGR